MPAIKNYLSLIKFSHTIFAMPFALIGFFVGLFLGNGKNQGSLSISGHSISLFAISMRLLLVVLCMVFARSAAMAFNRYLDRKFDALNPRTAIREIPKGIIRPGHALLFTIVNCILFILTAYFINFLCFILSPVALAVVLGYSFTKRFTPLCHLILGLGLSLAPIGAFLAVTGVFSLLPVLFSLSVICWVSGFDIIYALQDVDFDKSQKLYSIPAQFGKANALHVSELLHLFSAAFVIAAGAIGKFGWIYWLGLVVFLGCLIYQHSIVKPNDLRKVNIAFMTTNGIASVLFAFFAIADLFVHSPIFI